MKVSIFTVSHAADARWLHYCMRALAKHAHGFHSWHIVTPSDATFRDSQPHAYPPFPVWWHKADAPAGLPGHHHQQVLKMQADVFCRGADAIVYLDSDIIAERAVTPDLFLCDGKPIMQYCAPGHAVKNGVDRRWITNAARVTGKPTMVEAMRNPAICHDAKVVRWCREGVERTTGQALHDVFKRYWDAQTGWFPDRATGATKPGKPTLSEFITMGSFAWNMCRERYVWRDILQTGYRDLPFKRYWSHSGVTPALEAELEALCPKSPTLPTATAPASSS